MPIVNSAIISCIVNKCLENEHDPITITYPEGDVYETMFDNGEYEDNWETPDSPTYHEWYTLDFRVIRTLVPGPNKDPRYDFVSFTNEALPAKVECAGEVWYQADCPQNTP